MNNQELTLLTEGQIWGDDSESQLEVLKEYGTQATVTDLCILTGCKNGYFYTKSQFDNDVRIVDEDGKKALNYVHKPNISIRPVLLNSLLYSQSIWAITTGYDGTEEIEYGEYPQYAASETLQNELELRLKHKKGLNKTGRSYTFNSVPCRFNDGSFKPVTYKEYEYQGKKYIRIEANLGYNEHYLLLSNGVEYTNGDYVWVEVSPVKWLVDDKTQLLISKKCLVAGISFNPYRAGFDGCFDNTAMKKYLDNYMLHDLFQNTVSLNISNVNIQNHLKSSIRNQKLNKAVKDYQKKLIQEPKPEEPKVENNSEYEVENNFEYEEIETAELQAEKRKNPYNLDFGEVSEEDIIKGAVESGVAVFLHGPSSEGKSARVKQIDPTCEIIYLRNATPESLNGKSVYNQQTGEMIDVQPTWLKKLQEKCKNEPDRYHIVFFDEITNALPSIQGIAFNIVLDREVNGIWKLPENARIIAAGNDMKDSLAANQLAEPLFNRFAHVYIKTTTESWLNWASEYNIHPAIYTFIAYTKGAVLRSGYNGEKPNADPRKWEMASKMLYSTRNPKMLRALVGEDITREFVAFCNQEVITLNDVINENYNYRDIEVLNTAERYATIIGLTQVDEENLEKVRDFAISLGAEFGAIFDSLWVHGDESRLEKLAEIKLASGGLSRK